MNVRELKEMLDRCHIDDDAEVRVPYGDEPGEHDYVTGVVYCPVTGFILFTSTRADHEMRQGVVIYDRS